MTPAEYRSILSRLGLNLTEAARLLRVHRVTASGHWVRNGVTGAAEILLLLLDRRKVKPADIDKLFTAPTTGKERQEQPVDAPSPPR